MKKTVLEDLLETANEQRRHSIARANELLVSNSALLKRARAAESDRRRALELLALARAILVPGSGDTADSINAFLKEMGVE